MATSSKCVVIFNVMALYSVKLDRPHPNAEKSKQELKHAQVLL